MAAGEDRFGDEETEAVAQLSFTRLVTKLVKTELALEPRSLCLWRSGHSQESGLCLGGHGPLWKACGGVRFAFLEISSGGAVEKQPRKKGKPIRGANHKKES